MAGNLSYLVRTESEARTLRASYLTNPILMNIWDVRFVVVDPDTIDRFKELAYRFNRQELTPFEFFKRQVDLNCFLVQEGPRFIQYNLDTIRKILIRFYEPIFWTTTYERYNMLAYVDAKIQEMA